VAADRNLLTRFTVGDDGIYFADPHGDVDFAPKSGASKVVLAKNRPGAETLSANAEHVYWIERDVRGDASIVWLTRRLAGEPRVVVTGLRTVRNLVTDGRRTYYAEQGRAFVLDSATYAPIAEN
jgi:hypothetical protein